MLTITDKGIEVERLNTVITRLEEGFKRIYGDDINLSPDTPDGQMVGLIAQSIADINEVAAFIAQMLDPHKSMGRWLELNVAYAGIVRRGASYSRIKGVSVTGTAGLILPFGTIFEDQNKTRWVTEENYKLGPNGSVMASFRSVDYGVFSLQSGEPLTPVEVILGIESAVLTESSIDGVEEESDAALVQRFMSSHSVNNLDDRRGLEASLSALKDVSQAVVHENNTNATDAATGVPKNSVNAIVLGGNDTDIALALLTKIGGTAFFGSKSVTVPFKGKSRTVKFDRPKAVPVKISMVLKRNVLFSDIDTPAIKRALATNQFSIGESVYALGLVCIINQVDGFGVKSITVNGAQEAAIGLREYATIAEADVEVLIE